MYVGFDYTYIDIDALAQGTTKSFLASQIGTCRWCESNLWHRIARSSKSRDRNLSTREICIKYKSL